MSYCATEYKEGHLLEEIHREPNNSKDDYLISQLEKLVEEVKKKFPEMQKKKHVDGHKKVNERNSSSDFSSVQSTPKHKKNKRRSVGIGIENIPKQKKRKQPETDTEVATEVTLDENSIFTIESTSKPRKKRHKKHQEHVENDSRLDKHTSKELLDVSSSTSRLEADFLERFNFAESTPKQKKKHKKFIVFQNDVGNPDKITETYQTELPHSITSELQQKLKQKKRQEVFQDDSENQNEENCANQDTFVSRISPALTVTLEAEPTTKKKKKKHTKLHDITENNLESTNDNLLAKSSDSTLVSDAADLEHHKSKHKKKKHKKLDDASLIPTEDQNQDTDLLSNTTSCSVSVSEDMNLDESTTKRKKKKHKKRRAVFENDVEAPHEINDAKQNDDVMRKLHRNEKNTANKDLFEEADTESVISDATTYQKKKKKRHKTFQDEHCNVSTDDSSQNKAKYKNLDNKVHIKSPNSSLSSAFDADEFNTSKHRRKAHRTFVNAAEDEIEIHDTKLEELSYMKFEIAEQDRRNAAFDGIVSRDTDLELATSESELNSSRNIEEQPKEKENKQDFEENVIEETESSAKCKNKEHKQCPQNLAEKDESERESGEDVSKKSLSANGALDKAIADDFNTTDEENFSVIVDNVLESEMLDQEQIKHLENLSVMISWELPKMHTIETRISSAPTKQQKEQMHALGIELGRYSLQEDNTIKENWRKFCKVHDLPEDPKPFLQFKQKDGVIYITQTERIRFVQFLARNLNNRPLYSVLRRFQYLFNHHKWKQGRYTCEEDQLIRKLVDKHKFPYIYLSKLLNRSPQSILLRRRTLEKSENSRCIDWTQSRLQKFLKTILEVTLSVDLQELKDREIKTEEWDEIAMRMKKPAHLLRKAWLSKVYPHCFIRNPYFEIVIRDSIERMLEMKIKDWREVNWQKLASYHEGWTGSFLNKKFKTIITFHVPKEKHRDFNECIKIVRNVLPQYNFRPFNRYLLKNGILKMK